MTTDELLKELDELSESVLTEAYFAPASNINVSWNGKRFNNYRDLEAEISKGVRLVFGYCNDKEDLKEQWRKAYDGQSKKE